MNSPFRWSMIATASLLLGTGCGSVKKVTNQERAQSFAPVEAVTVGSEPIGNYVVKRTGIIIIAEVTGFNRVEANRVETKSRAAEYMSYGSAAPMDRRGYFVTAAHCLQGSKVNVTFMTEKGIELREARVVFKGDPSSSISDFAVLHVPGKLDYILNWATDFGPGDTIISCGVNRQGVTGLPEAPTIQVNVEPNSGRIEKTVKQTLDGIEYQTVLHSSPLSHGNSGGPMIDQEGRLIGINIEGAAAFPAFHPKHRFAIAVRPDLKWLKRLIEQDAARQAKPAS